MLFTLGIGLRKPTFSVVLVERNDLVYHFLRSVATFLRVLDLLGVPPLLDYEIVDVQHCVCLLQAELRGRGRRAYLRFVDIESLYSVTVAQPYCFSVSFLGGVSNSG